MTDDPVHLPAFVADIFGGSRSEARRTLAGGGIKINGEVVTEMDIPASRLASLPGEPRKVISIGTRRTHEL